MNLSPNSWTNVLSAERNEIVFENRNKNYGAFYIRREYFSTLIIALLTTVSAILLLAVIVPSILSVVNKASDIPTLIDKEFKNILIDITPQTTTPAIEKVIVAPTPKPTATPKVESLAHAVVVDHPVETKPATIDIETQPSPEAKTDGKGEKAEQGKPNSGIPNSFGLAEKADKPFTMAEINPEFTGGEKALYDFLRTNIIYPQMEREQGISGRVYIEFVIEKDGSVSLVSEKRGVAGGMGLTKEAIRVIKKMPKWKAGMQNGKPVRVQMVVPVNFALR